MPKECCTHPNPSIQPIVSRHTFSLLLKHICVAMVACGCGLSAAAQTMHLQSGTVTAVLNEQTADLHLNDSLVSRLWCPWKANLFR
jgi:hypothetical protein